MMATVYVATKAENWRMARWVMQVAREFEQEVTYDWTYDVEMGVDVQMEEETRALAKKDLDGVARADYLIVIPQPGIVGVLVEVGYFLRARQGAQRILVWGDWANYTVFFDLLAFKQYPPTFHGLEILMSNLYVKDEHDEEEE